MKNHQDVLDQMRIEGKPVDSQMVAEFEKQNGCVIPRFLMEIFKVANGGRFRTDAVIQFPGHSIAVYGILGIGSTETGCIDGIAMLIEDRLDCSKYLPFAGDVAGNYFVFEKIGHAVGFWDHESLEVTRVSSSLDTFFEMIGFSNPYQELERICASGRLGDIETKHERDLKSGTVCEIAARLGNLMLVKECVVAGFGVGLSLVAAARSGQFEIVDYLLECGHDVNGKFFGKSFLDMIDSSSDAYGELVKRGAVSAKM